MVKLLSCLTMLTAIFIVASADGKPYGGETKQRLFNTIARLTDALVRTKEQTAQTQEDLGDDLIGSTSGLR